jgi:hypothetical protein
LFFSEHDENIIIPERKKEMKKERKKINQNSSSYVFLLKRKLITNKLSGVFIYVTVSKIQIFLRLPPLSPRIWDLVLPWLFFFEREYQAPNAAQKFGFGTVINTQKKLFFEFFSKKVQKSHF